MPPKTFFYEFFSNLTYKVSCSSSCTIALNGIETSELAASSYTNMVIGNKGIITT